MIFESAYTVLCCTVPELCPCGGVLDPLPDRRHPAEAGGHEVAAPSTETRHADHRHPGTETVCYVHIIRRRIYERHHYKQAYTSCLHLELGSFSSKILHSLLTIWWFKESLKEKTPVRDGLADKHPNVNMEKCLFSKDPDYINV